MFCYYPITLRLCPQQLIQKTRLARDISLYIPLMSSAMDTVTESRLAIVMANQGGIGVLHKNMSIKVQADEVAQG